ncbi:MAG TPA: diacylglycerol kinase family protein [Devosia sp.]|jgi:diacylglycerol kinase family enzyme|uniref:diacylglycerol/lipid kinase family protein n=1 Tax=Devosia sp. TaxID=1871048 RepID=UPI002DDD345A|nr:diacylglycerol kinase family protein [Devosia sp.]HEV2516565.1 diacylglycerol kinase family protein [Devosia sp.]
MRFVGVFNKDGGTFRTMDMAAFVATAERIFTEHGQSIECRVVGGDELITELERAAVDPAADVVLAGGGDGTVSAAAGICFAHKMVLAVLPAGTMNLFARSLGGPLQLEAALGAIARGQVAAVDIATANGRPFVHQFSVGVHSRLVRIRNGLTYHSRWGKMLASLRAIGLALSRPPVFDAVISTAQGTERRQATAIAVSNNVLGEGHVPYAEAVDRGVLGVYVVKPMPPAELARLALALAFGNWKAHPLVSEREVKQVSLSFPHRKASALAVIDGELIPLQRQVDLRIHAGGLRVVLPGADAAPEREDPQTEAA